MAQKGNNRRKGSTGRRERQKGDERKSLSNTRGGGSGRKNEGGGV
jgi:hypothetical protein